MKPIKDEINALVPLLEQSWETPEELSAALIVALDKARASRKTYVAVMQFGNKAGQVFYQGLGPYAGSRSAANAAKTHGKVPGMPFKFIVVPIVNEQGLDNHLKEVG